MRKQVLSAKLSVRESKKTSLISEGYKVLGAGHSFCARSQDAIRAEWQDSKTDILSFCRETY